MVTSASEPDGDAEEPRGLDANHGEGHLVQRDGLAQDRLRAAEVPAPVRVTDRPRRRRARTIVVGCQQSPDGGPQAERAVVGTGDGQHRGDAGRPARAHADGRLPVLRAKQADERRFPCRIASNCGNGMNELGCRPSE